MRGLTTLLLFLLFAVGKAEAQVHTRLIVTRGDAGLTAFDPLTNRYRAGSIEAVTAFADRWREKLGEENLFLVDVPLRELSLGDRIYLALADSTLRQRAMQRAGYVAAAECDSVLNSFRVTRGAVDSLGETEWLVVDRYVVEGHAAVEARRFDFRELRVSRAVEERFGADGDRVRRFFLIPVARLDTTVTTRDALFGPSAFSDLFHCFHFAAAATADVSFFAPPVLDATLSAGEVCLGDVLRLFRYDNALVTARITGKQLDEWLEKIFGMRFFRIEGPESDLVRLKVPYYLHDDVAGIRFRVNLTARYGHRVTVYENERGEPFDPQKSYTVVLNSFRARDLQQMGVRVDTVAADYRLALARWLVQHPELRPRARDNWSAGPERWVRSIAERERRTIFERR